MTKQEIMIDYADFLATVLECKKSIKVPTDATLLEAYLYGYVLAYLRPDWFQGDEFDEAFSDLRYEFASYRAKADREFFFASIAKALKIVSDNDDRKVYEDGDIKFHLELNQGIVPTQDIGLIISKEPKDRKFVTRTMLRYLRRAFPKPKAVPMVLAAPKTKPTVSAILERGGSIVGPTGQATKIPLSSLGGLPLGDMSFQKLQADEKQCFMYEMWRYIIMLMGETPYSKSMIAAEDMRWSYEYGVRDETVVDMGSRFARDAACLDPLPQVCYRCRPEFRRLLTTIYYVRNSQLPIGPMYSRKGSGERLRYFELADETLVPVIDEMEEEINQQVNSLGDAIIAKQRMKLQLGKAEAENKKLHAQLNEMSLRMAAPELKQELSKLKEELAAVRRKSESDLKRTKADLSRLQEENKRLSENLKASQASYNEINEQYINLLWEDGMFLDEDDLREQDAPPAPSGVRERIGDEAYEKLAGKRLVVVGGHANTQRVLRELFPNWRFFAVDEKLTDSMTAVDAVAILARYTSHKNVEQARAAVKSADIPMLTISYNGPTSICQAIAKMI